MLDKVADHVKQHMDADCEIHSDGGGKPWTIPPDILPTSDRPDLVVINRVKKSISIFELTVPYEANIRRNHQYKCHKYIPLILILQKLDFNVKYFSVEIGNRGFISRDNSNRLYAFLNCGTKKCPTKTSRALKCLSVKQHY